MVETEQPLRHKRFEQLNVRLAEKVMRRADGGFPHRDDCIPFGCRDGVNPGEET
jgi:hypothetical protein